jgi:hypothetical protein
LRTADYADVTDKSRSELRRLAPGFRPKENSGQWFGALHHCIIFDTVAQVICEKEFCPF